MSTFLTILLIILAFFGGMLAGIVPTSQAV